MKNQLNIRNAAQFAIFFIVIITFFPHLASARRVSRLIVPGKSIGKLHLGPNGASELNKLPKPNVLDAGMSQTRQVWVNNAKPSETVFIHTVSNGVIDAKPIHGVTITEIRVTSARFHTKLGDRAGHTLAKIRAHFPALIKVEDEKSVIYSDEKMGIAFEFDRDNPAGKCIGISIFLSIPDAAKGHPVSHDEVDQILDKGDKPSKK